MTVASFLSMYITYNHTKQNQIKPNLHTAALPANETAQLPNNIKPSTRALSYHCLQRTSSAHILLLYLFKDPLYERLYFIIFMVLDVRLQERDVIVRVAIFELLFQPLDVA